jgi:hypothetical protein
MLILLSVDLNRNFLTTREFEELATRNTSMYEYLSATLNPKHVYSLKDIHFLVESAKNIMKFGYSENMKGIFVCLSLNANISLLYV